MYLVVMEKLFWKACGWITLGLGVACLFSGLFIPGFVCLGSGWYVLSALVD